MEVIYVARESIESIIAPYVKAEYRQEALESLVKRFLESATSQGSSRGRNGKQFKPQGKKYRPKGVNHHFVFHRLRSHSRRLPRNMTRAQQTLSLAVLLSSVTRDLTKVEVNVA